MKRPVVVALGSLLILGAATWYALLPKPPLLEGVTFSRQVFDREGERLALTLAADDKYRVWTPLEQISPELITATLTHEDRWFHYHPGINPFAVGRSLWQLLCRRGEAGSGASTVTMQLARLRHGLHTRNTRGKLAQMVYALQLERHYTKREILQAYLNLAPYGRNVEGVGAASILYFNKTPDRLTLYEAVALSVIPQSPTARSPRSDKANRALDRAQHRLLQKVAPETAQLGSLAFSARARASAPALAPHFVRHLLAREKRASALRSTLSASRQRLLETEIRRHLRAHAPAGVRNAAALLVDFEKMEVLAQVGSAAFDQTSIQGQVDGTRSRRSPGSALKPFIYALALDQGLIHPLSLLVDTPRTFSDYNPDNFDRDYCGPVSATEALTRSRNVPAVTLVSALRGETFHGFLLRAGVRLPRAEQFYGPTLPLGGGEVTMEELVLLYTALARGGELQPLRRLLPAPSPQRGRRLFSAEAAFLTLDMLTQTPLAGLAGPADVAWKTGTSNGFRDAWTVAVFDRYVLAVWVGNFDGRPNPAFVGGTCAAPLLFRMVHSLRAAERAGSRPLLPPTGANLRRVEFCAVSGSLPGPACRHQRPGWFIPGVSPIAPCEVHRPDAGTLLADAPPALESWPSELLHHFSRTGLPRRSAIAASREIEQSSRQGRPPRITSPKPGAIYLPDAVRDGIALTAEIEADSSHVQWFADKTALGRAGPGHPLSWRAPVGKHLVTAVDNRGRSASVEIEVTGVALF